LEIEKKTFGENHPQFASSLNNLAELYRSQGRYSEAEPLYLRALSISEQQLGFDHPNTASSLNNLALLRETQGKYTEACTLAQRALVIFQNALGDQHPNTQNSLLNVKFFHVQMLLVCDKQTLISILQSLAEEAKLPYLNAEIILGLLEAICTDPELLHRLQEQSSR
jgi:tetratricopeptide (TPR) repeat protein